MFEYDVETDRKLTNSNIDKKLREEQFKLKLVTIDRKMEDKDKFFLKAQFRDSVGEIEDRESAIRDLFDLLIEKRIIASDNVKDLITALMKIKRSDLVEILEDEGVTASNPITPPKDVISTSKEETLTDQYVLTMCKELTPSDLTDLTVAGFGLGLSVVTRARYDTKTTVDAAINIFREWKNVAPINEFSRPHGNKVPVYSKSGLKLAFKSARLNHLL